MCTDRYKVVIKLYFLSPHLSSSSIFYFFRASSTVRILYNSMTIILCALCRYLFFFLLFFHHKLHMGTAYQITVISGAKHSVNIVFSFCLTFWASYTRDLKTGNTGVHNGT
uniref:Uncharacterized protein n=1 Tax=Cacopsylla melanoneura TaxID=428564 RepID=A0A8D9B6M0_9HEMI